MGMNMAQQGGGINAAQLFQMGAQQQAQAPQQSAPVQPGANAWKCACGATATGKFCPECGAKKPEPQPAAGWTCSCGAVNTGIAAASGMYVKVVDADDWVGPESLEQVMAVLRGEVGKDDPLDMLVTNYVYDKVGKRNKHVVNFRHAMEPGKRLTWDDLGHFGLTEYILMHALIYRTAVVRESKMQLPEHTFYVDFIYAYQPFPWVKSLQYLDTPFYHYFIGRDGQSVQTDVMIRRVDQLRLVNQCMVRATPERGTVPDGLYRYMIHFLAIQSSVASVFMILSRDPENYEKKKAMWADIEAYSPTIYKDVRKKAMSRALNLHGSLGRFVIRKGYFVAEHVVGFN